MTTEFAETDRVVSLGDDDLVPALADGAVALAALHAGRCGTCERSEPILESIAADADATMLLVDVESTVEFGA